jgi:hypothetical protein
VEKRSWKQVHFAAKDNDGQQVFATALYSAEWLRANEVKVGGLVQMKLPNQAGQVVGEVTCIEPSPMISGSEGRVIRFTRDRRLPSGISASDRANSGVPRQANWVGDRMPGRDLKIDAPLQERRWRRVHLLVDGEDGIQAYATLLFSQEWLQKVGKGVGDSFFVDVPEMKLSGQGKIRKVEPYPVVPTWEGQADAVLRSFGNVEAAERLVESFSEVPISERYLFGGEETYEISFVLEYDERNRVDFKLLRPKSWLETRAVTVGKRVYVELPEQGVEGDALVLSITLRGPVSIVDGDRVTGTFRHSEAETGDLWIKGEPTALGVTPGHLIWSVDRLDWVCVKDLRKGERVCVWDGTTTVESYKMTGKREPVYNIEVQPRHVYRVGEQGMLVHNSSAGVLPVTSAPVPPSTTVACDECQRDWGVPTGNQYYQAKVKDVEYEVKTPRLPDGFPRILIGYKWVTPDDIVKMGKLRHPVVEQMTFRFEGNKPLTQVPNSGRGSQASPKARAWAKYAAGNGGDDPGHVIKQDWGGPGKMPNDTRFGIFKETASFLNIVPLKISINRRGGAWNRNEDNVSQRLLPNYDVVCVRITFTYDQYSDYPARPKTFFWEYKVRDAKGAWITNNFGPPVDNSF